MSILVSASFLGWPFAIFKVVVAFVTGVIGGAVVDMTDSKPAIAPKVSLHNVNAKKLHSRILEAFRYGLFDLLGMIYRWIALGIVAAAIITMAFPPGALTKIGWIGGYRR